MFELSRLPNGLRVVSSTMPRRRGITVCIFVGVGSRYETDDEAGLSHFIEHLFFKGTDRRPTARQISEAVEGVGGYINAATNREYTEYFCKVTRPHFSIALDVLADALLHSRFDPVEVEKERRVILEELNMVRDDPSEWVGVLIDETLWPDHPLGRDIAGSQESVASFSRELALAFKGRHYSPADCVVSIAGNIGHPEAVDSVAALLGDWPAFSAPAFEPAREHQHQPRLRLEYKRAEQTQLCLAVPGLPRRDADRYTLTVLNTILGGGMSSRLFVDLREDRALCYDVSSHVVSLTDSGALLVFAGVDPAQSDAALRGILDQLDGMRRPIPHDELTKAKEYLKGQLLLSLEGTSAVASWFGRQELLEREIQTPEQVIDAIDAVAGEAITGLAERLFRTDRLNLAVVGPTRRAHRFRSMLRLDGR